jgi:hypothetical protein
MCQALNKKYVALQQKVSMYIKWFH